MDGNICDVNNRLNELLSGKPIQYGKARLENDKPYKLWDRETNEFNEEKIIKLYEYFKFNLLTLIKTKNFEYKYVNPDELLVATKGKIWDWTNDKEKEDCIQNIKQYGLNFPIFTLPQGELHNQIVPLKQLKELKKLNKYNSYKGNHRIEALQEIYHQTGEPKEVLIIIIPPYCEKSCTGFQFTPIDYNKENELTNYKLKTPVKLYHTIYNEDLMKISNMAYLSEADGIAFVNVDDYNTAFRILMEFQYLLTAPLTSYYNIYKSYPEGFNDKLFNDKQSWEDALNDIS